MPLNRYFKGHGEEVMSNMKDQYGEEKGEQVFYATANKRKMLGEVPSPRKDDAKVKKAKSMRAPKYSPNPGY